MNKKILIISSEFLPDPGGIGNHAYQLAKGLAAEGYGVTVLADITYSNRETLSAFIKNISFFFIPIIRKKPLLFTYFKRMWLAIRLASNNDLIICSGKFSLWLIHLLRLFSSRKRIMAVVHGTELLLPSGLQKKITNNALGKANNIVAVSHYTDSFIIPEIKKTIDTTIIPNGIDNNEFITHKKKSTITSPLQLITIGSVTERKGQENVINAIPDLLLEFPKLIYHIVGAPVISGKLRTLCESLSIEKHVIFHGKLSRTDLLSLLETSDVKLMLSNHTSTGDFEGFGIALLEANACGLPSIASNKGGTADAVADKFSGRLVNVTGKKEIVAALKEIVNNYDRFSTNAIQWAKEHDWKLIIKKYVAIIEHHL